MKGIGAEGGRAGEKLDRNVWVAGFVSLFNDISSEMVYPLLPLFLTGVLKASRTSLGLVEGIAEATASLLKVFSGVLSDRFHNRKLPMFLGYGVSLAARPFIAAAGSWTAVLGARFADRAGKGIRTAPRDAVIADSAPPALRGKAFGVHRGMDTAGAALGPALAMVMLAAAFTMRTVFWWSIVPGLVALLLIGFIRETGVRTQPGGPAPSVGAAFGQRGAFRDFLWVTALFTLGNSSDTFLLLKARSVGFSVEAVAGVYLLFNLFYAAVAGPIGAASDRLGLGRVVLLSFPYYAGVYLGFALAGGPAAVVVLFLLYGPFQAVEEGVKKAYVSRLIPTGFMGSGMGAYNAVKGVMLLPASLLTGILWDRAGAAAAFGADAALALGAGLLFAFCLWRRRERPDLGRP
ncbi:MAG: MFS transporter [Acidobacteriota bacterium]